MPRYWVERAFAVVVLLVTACSGGAALDPVAGAPRAIREDAPPAVRVAGDNAIAAVNSTGIARTLPASGSIDTSNLFVRSIGTNGRACVSCHVASQGWTITPAGVSDRFERTRGLDPIFRSNDGANSPAADVSTLEARRSAFTMLVTKGLIRVGIGIPANAEFELAQADDPYGYASSAELSLFRRPLPSANLGFLATVMWDGRETLAGMSIVQDLAHQSNGATQGHAQRVEPISDADRAEIVSFESGITFAQALDFGAGPLDLAGATGGVLALSETPFQLGINDTLGADPTGHPFDPVTMTLFDAWTGAGGNRMADARAAVARGQEIFNHHPIAIAGVRGLNDALGVSSIGGTCTTCHNTPGVGNHSVSLPLDLGLTDASRRTADLPLYTLRNRATGETIRTSDPGRALITGRWKDVARFKGPILRGLAARAPYFHNGSARDLPAVIDFYQDRFAIGFTAQEKADLAAFLRAL